MIEVRRSYGAGEKVEVGFRGAEQDIYDLVVALHVQTSLSEFGAGPIAFNSAALNVIGKALHEFVDERTRRIELRQADEARQTAETFKAKRDALRAKHEPEPEPEHGA